MAIDFWNYTCLLSWAQSTGTIQKIEWCLSLIFIHADAGGFPGPFFNMKIDLELRMVEIDSFSGKFK
jgi:hypothetical protein